MGSQLRRETRVVVRCVCGATHRLRNVEAARKVIQAFVDGELITVTKRGVMTGCVMNVLTDNDEIHGRDNEDDSQG